MKLNHTTQSLEASSPIPALYFRNKNVSLPIGLLVLRNIRLLTPPTLPHLRTDEETSRRETYG